MSKTVVISARVPVDIANMIKRTCETQNLTTSKYLQKIALQPSTPIKIENRHTDTFNLPKEVKPILSVAGGLGIGTIVYNILMNNLSDDKFTSEQKQNISILCAIASGIGGLIAVDKLLEK